MYVQSTNLNPLFSNTLAAVGVEKVRKFIVRGLEILKVRKGDYIATEKMLKDYKYCK